MRVTNKMLSHSFLADMRTNLKNMQKIQEQMTSGKEIRKPSDDPAKIARAMQLHTDINANKQYNSNISDTINWLDITDTALGQLGNVLQRMSELLMQSGNAAYSSTERQSIKDEFNERIEEFTQILNTSYDGKYIFGGTRTTTKPVITDEVNGNKNLKYNIDTNDESYIQSEISKINQKMKVEISPGVTIDYNVSASEIIEFDGKNLKDTFSKILSDLDNENGVLDLAGSDMEDIKKAMDNLLKKRSEVGAKQNRMESAKSKNEDETFNLTEILSKTEDIDITEKTMEYATLQTVYMSSLQTSARVIQPTLLDYL
ncbi:flagellar hook-associated protein 3 FlgL [Clostridium sp. USBA 49]|uniref:flagellar hook-associated protein FlgL n=1 Tax=Clostridium sp. USBA 49 TaxID=1881060 RepID=UPI00099ACDB5|nr:flagellar hook-associated protein FlgL [Clostridium sp. USBA 49]SKA72717.1 flagellar hook-associated protein 3 FlgL [Clostridium sp. USBA 49]